MTLKNYYEQLYIQPRLEDEQQTRHFQGSLNLPMLTEDQTTTLIAEIMEQELKSAITRLKAKSHQAQMSFLPNGTRLSDLS